MTKEEIMKAVEEVVASTLAAKEEKEEETQKSETATPAAEASATPAEPLVKAEEEEEEEEDSKEDKKEDKKEDMAKKAKKKAMMKKSETSEEVIELDEEEVELIKAWRLQKDEEPTEEVVKSEAAPEVKNEETEQLRKSLTEQSELIKSLTEKIEKMAAQPAYEKRSISSLEAIEKSEATQDVSKQQVLEKMLELQLAGKGVRSNHISEMETTGNISDQQVRALVMNSFKQGSN